MSKFGATLRNVASAAGVMFGVFGAVQVIRSSLNVIKEFDLQMATLAGVLNVNRSEMKALSEDAKRLGAITEFSAGQVGELQEAYARLGFSQLQILNVTEATLQGATALQAELGDAAELVGATLNQFGLQSDKAADTVDVLSRATQISALNFERLQTALPIVGKTANVVGVDLRRTSALLGVLASNGIDASTAGTGLRNVFIELSKKGISFEDAMEQINTSTNKAKTAFDLFGKRGVTIGATLAASGSRIKEYEENLQDVAGTSKKLAETQLKTLDGSLKLLDSAWKGYVLNVNDATSAGEQIRKAILFLAENLDTIIKAIGRAAIAFVAFKAALISYRLLTTIAAFATNKLTFSVRSLNTAVKANPLGLIVSSVTLLISLLPIWGDETEDQTEKQKDLNEELARTNELMRDADPEELAGAILAGADISLFSLTEIEKGLRYFQGELESLSEDRIVLGAKENESVEEYLERRSKAYTKEKMQIKEIIAALKERAKQIRSENDSTPEGIIVKVEKQIKELQAKKSASLSESEIQKYNEQIKVLQNRLKQLNSLGELTPMKAKTWEEANVEIAKTNDEVRELADGTESLARAAKLASQLARIAMKDDIQKLMDMYVGLANAIGTALDQKDRRIQKSLDRELDATKDNISRQERLAELGLANTLAFEQQKAAEIEVQKERQAEKAVKREKTLAYLTAFREYLRQDPDTAAGKALAQMAIADTISGLFYEGTERVEDSIKNPMFKGRDGYVIRVDGDERIMNPAQSMEIRQKLGNISNNDLVKLATGDRSGLSVNALNDSRIIKHLKENTEAVRSSGMQVDWDSHDQRIERMVDGKVRKVIRTLSKKSRL